MLDVELELEEVPVVIALHLEVEDHGIASLRSQMLESWNSILDW